MRTCFWIFFTLLVNTALGQGAPDIQWAAAGHSVPHVGTIEYSPDGLHFYTSGSDRTLKVWRASDGAFVRTVPLYNGTSFALSPDGLAVATAVQDNPNSAVKVIRLSDGALLQTFPLSGPRGVAFSPNGLYLAAVAEGGNRVWRLSDGQQVATLSINAPSGTPLNIRFSPNGQYVGIDQGPVVQGFANKLSIFRTSDWLEHQTFTAGSPNVNSGFNFSPDSTHVVWHGGAGGVGVYSMATSQYVRELPATGTGPYSFARFSPDGSIVCASSDKALTIWRFSDGVQLGNNQDASRFKAFAFSPNASQLSVARLNNNRRWAEIRQENGQSYSQVSATFTEFDYQPDLLTVSPDGQYLTVAGIMGQSADLRSAATGALLNRWEGLHRTHSLSFTPDGTRLLIGLQNVNVYSIPSASLVTSYPGTAGFQAASVMPNGTHYVAGAGFVLEGEAQACDVHVRRLSDGSIDYTLGSHSEEIWGTGVSNDGRFAYSIDRNQTKIWDLSTRMLTFIGPGGFRTHRPAFSIDSFFIALPVPGAVEVRRADGKLVRTIPIPGGATPTCVAFNNPRSHVLVGVGSKIYIFRVKDMLQIKMYDAETGSGGPFGIRTIAVSPDGQHFFYGRDDCTVVKAKLPPL